MARTEEYDVVYPDGRSRVKLLSKEDAEALAARKGFVVKRRAAAQNKQRTPSEEK